MKKDDGDLSILANIGSPLIERCQKVILFCVRVLAVLMAFVVVWSTVDVLAIIYREFMTPNFTASGLDEFLTIFGAFLLVLIAIEIFFVIVLYLRKDVGHLRLVIATALMAIARKVIIIDYEHMQASQLYAVAALILVLGATYWLVRHHEIAKE